MPVQPVPTASPDTSPAFLTKDPAAAYEHFLSFSKQVPVDKVKHITVDADLALHNVRAGATACRTLQFAVQTAVPNCPIERFLELPSLALALLYASDLVVGHASTGEIARRVAAQSKLRTPMLMMLEVFADPAVGLADPDRVQALRSGNGHLKRSHDAVGIAAYFNELGPAVVGKHPFTAAQIQALASEGQWLIQQLTPRAAVPVPTGPDAAAVIRDALWTLLSDRYDQLRAVMSVVVGLREVDTHVPQIGKRLAAKQTEEEGSTSEESTASTTTTTPAKGPKAETSAHSTARGTDASDDSRWPIP